MLDSGNLELPDVGLGDSALLDIDQCLPKINLGIDKVVILTVTLRSRHSEEWAEPGHEVAWYQVRLLEPGLFLSLTRQPELSSKVDLEETKTTLTVLSRGNFSLVFDRARGHLTEMTVHGTTLLEADPATGAAIRLSFWRPPTDNDQPHSRPYWERFGVDALTSQLREFSFEKIKIYDPNVEGALITTKTFISPPVLDWGWTVITTYEISPSPSLTVKSRLVPSGSMPKHIPRVGLDLRLPRRLDAVRWLGLGPGESYPDKCSSQRVGIWEVDSVDELHTPYDVPQEGGNRMKTRWVSITDVQGGGLRAKPWDPELNQDFSFRAARYADQTVQDAKHPCDLVEEDGTLLRLDYKVAGVGTAACGPGVREDLLVKTEEMSFGFIIEPIGV
jgi:beta-galactosidase